MTHYEKLPLLYSSGLVKAPQIILLALLTDDDSGTLVTELAKRTGMPTAHASMTVLNLVQDNQVEKRNPWRDARTRIVYLTAGGKKRAEAMLAALTA